MSQGSLRRHFLTQRFLGQRFLRIGKIVSLILVFLLLGTSSWPALLYPAHFLTQRAFPFKKAASGYAAPLADRLQAHGFKITGVSGRGSRKNGEAWLKLEHADTFTGRRDYPVGILIYSWGARQKSLHPPWWARSDPREPVLLRRLADSSFFFKDWEGTRKSHLSELRRIVVKPTRRLLGHRIVEGRLFYTMAEQEEPLWWFERFWRAFRLLRKPMPRFTRPAFDLLEATTFPLATLLLRLSQLFTRFVLAPLVGLMPRLP